jgi:hypothetical protein
MNNPLHWNTLTESAAWLSEKLKRPISERALLNIAVPADDWSYATGDEKGLLNFLLPKDVYAVGISDYSIKEWEDLMPWETLTHDDMANKHGGLPDGRYYTGECYTGLLPLSVGQIQDLFLYKQVSINEVCITHLSEKTRVFILPLNQRHVVKLESVGLYGDDLLALAKQMATADDVPSMTDAGSTIATEQEASTDDRPKDMTQWQARAEIRAPELWQEIQDNGTEPKKALLTIELSKDLRNEGYTGQRSKLTNDNVERHFVSKWQPPNKGNKGTKTGT